MQELGSFSHRARRRLTVALAASAMALLSSAAMAQDGVRMSPPYMVFASFAAFSHRAIALRDSLVVLARAQVGRRYRHGGAAPERGFDCSGLVAFVLSDLRLTMPRTAAQQATVGSEVVKDTAVLRPGDLLTFGAPRVTHVGIYIGNGRFIHASSRAGRVVESSLFRAPAPGIKPWRGVRRLVAADSAAAPADSTG